MSGNIWSYKLILLLTHQNQALYKLSSQDLPYLAGVDANMDCGSVGLFSLDTLNVDDILLPVDLHNFADLLAFVVSTDNLFVNKTSS